MHIVIDQAFMRQASIMLGLILIGGLAGMVTGYLINAFERSRALRLERERTIRASVMDTLRRSHERAWRGRLEEATHEAAPSPPPPPPPPAGRECSRDEKARRPAGW